MPTSLKEIAHLKQLLKWGKELGEKNIYHAICFNCGTLLFGDKSSHRWDLIPELKNQIIPIEQIYDEIPKNYPYRFVDENNRRFLYKCRVCKSHPNILQYVRLITPGVNKMTIPPELGVFN